VPTPYEEFLAYQAQQRGVLADAIRRETGAPAKGIPGPLPLGPPPPGTYDPAIDYNAGASQRGYQNQFDDAATLYEQGREDYGLNVGDLTRNLTRGQQDLTRNQSRLLEDYGLAKAELGRQYGILGRQQGERAAQQGVTSSGLLGKSARVRATNQERERMNLQRTKDRGVQDIGTAWNRLGEDYTQGKTRLDLGFGRVFGGFQGNQFTNPLTGRPMVGSLLTGTTRAATENQQFQTFSDQQRAYQAADNGYIAPGILPTTQSAAAAREFQRRRGR